MYNIVLQNKMMGKVYFKQTLCNVLSTSCMPPSPWMGHHNVPIGQVLYSFSMGDNFKVTAASKLHDSPMC